MKDKYIKLFHRTLFYQAGDTGDVLDAFEDEINDWIKNSNFKIIDINITLCNNPDDQSLIGSVQYEISE